MFVCASVQRQFREHEISFQIMFQDSLGCFIFFFSMIKKSKSANLKDFSLNDVKRSYSNLTTGGWVYFYHATIFSMKCLILAKLNPLLIQWIPATTKKRHICVFPLIFHYVFINLQTYEKIQAFLSCPRVYSVIDIACSCPLTYTYRHTYL